MKFQGKSKNAVIGATPVVAALATAFWVLALSPKREEANRLGAQVEQLEGSLAQHRAESSGSRGSAPGFPSRLPCAGGAGQVGGAGRRMKPPPCWCR